MARKGVRRSQEAARWSQEGIIWSMEGVRDSKEGLREVSDCLGNVTDGLWKVLDHLGKDFSFPSTNPQAFSSCLQYCIIISSPFIETIIHISSLNFDKDFIWPPEHVG